MSASTVAARSEGSHAAPWCVLGAGLLAIALAILWLRLLGPVATPWRALLLTGGLLTVGSGVALQPASSLVLLTAAAAAWLGRQALEPECDSLRLMLTVMAVFAAVSALLVQLPRTARRVVVSLVILFHFGGILSAVTSVPPQPWLSLWAWTHVYRPYLEFMYLNNAYHFYSPDPGPPTLLWAYVRYQDGTARWVKLPNRDDYPLAINYQRRLSLTESINQLTNSQSIPHLQAESLKQARQEAARDYQIPLHPSIELALQYRKPTPFSERMLRAYARHIAYVSPHLEDPSQQVISVKLYRVVHSLPAPRDLVAGLSPLDETSYLPYYQGEFTPDGTLIDPQDPFLYWLIPIVRVPRSSSATFSQTGALTLTPANSEVVNFLEAHATGRRPTLPMLGSDRGQP